LGKIRSGVKKNRKQKCEMIYFFCKKMPIITIMRRSFSSTSVLIFVALLLCLSGCRNLTYWKKNDPKPHKNAILTKESDVMAFNDFRTIDASMVEPSGGTKKSFLWENSQANDINRRLGVKD
jgi:hypothetical protein